MIAVIAGAVWVALIVAVGWTLGIATSRRDEQEMARLEHIVTNYGCRCDTCDTALADTEAA